MVEISQWDKHHSFTRPRTRVEAIQYSSKPIELGDDYNDEEVEYKITPEVDSQGSQDETLFPMLPLVVPQYEQGINHSLHQVQVSNLEAPYQHNQTSDSTYVFEESIDKVNLRWCMEDLQILYERDSFISETSHPIRAIYKEKLIDLSWLAGAPLLDTAFDRYQLCQMTRPQVNTAQHWCRNSMPYTMPWYH